MFIEHISELNSRLLQTSSRTHYTTQKDAGKWSTNSTASGNTWLLLPYVIFTRVRLDQTWSIATMYGLELLNPHFSTLIGFKIVYAVLQGLTYFPASFHIDAKLQRSMSSTLYVHQFRPLQLGLSILHTRSRIVHISFVFQLQEESSTQTTFSRELLLWGTNSYTDASPNATIQVKDQLTSILLILTSSPPTFYIHIAYLIL